MDIGVSEVFAAESKLQTTVCSAGSNQGHEWNLKVQGQTLQLPSPLNSEISRMAAMWSSHHEANNQRLSPQGDAQWSKRNTNRIEISFWLTMGRQVIRKQIYNCVVCRRYEGRSYKVEPSSDIPEFRFKEGYPFKSTGVDFAGPLFVKTVFGREI